MNWRPVAEWEALWRFLAAPRRMPVHHAKGRGWLARCLFFAASLLALNLALEAIALAPLSDWLQIQSLMPDKVDRRLLFEAIVMAPVLEELVFRAGLRSAGYTLFVGPALVLWMATPPGTLSWSGLALAAAGLLTQGQVHLRLWRRPGARIANGRRFIAWYPVVFWTYCGLFGLAHTGNFAWQGPRSLWLPLFVLPQFLTGTVAGYLRLRDGLRASMLLHFLVNASALSMVLLLSS